MTAREAGEYLGLSERSVRELAARGHLAHHRIGPAGGRLRFAQADLDAYRAARRVPARADNLTPMGVKIEAVKTVQTRPVTGPDHFGLGRKRV